MVRALPRKTMVMTAARKLPAAPVTGNPYAAPRAFMSDTFKVSLKVVSCHCHLDSPLSRIHILTVWRIHPTRLSSGLHRGDFSWCRLSAELRRKEVRVNSLGLAIRDWSITAFLRRLQYSSPCQNIA